MNPDTFSPENLLFFHRTIRFQDHGRTLTWGVSISQPTVDLLKQGEIFTLLNEAGEPYSRVLMDRYGAIREILLPSDPDVERLVQAWFGFPPYAGPSRRLPAWKADDIVTQMADNEH